MVVAVFGCRFDWSAGVRADVGSHRVVVYFAFVRSGMKFGLITGAARDVVCVGDMVWHDGDKLFVCC